MESVNPFDEILRKLTGIENQIRLLSKLEVDTAPDWMTVQQAADYLNLSKQTVYRKVSDGKLPFYKSGKKLHFKKSELHSFVSLGKVDAI